VNFWWRKRFYLGQKVFALASGFRRQLKAKFISRLQRLRNLPWGTQACSPGFNISGFQPCRLPALNAAEVISLSLLI
jgi:hypothetical protein